MICYGYRNCSTCRDALKWLKAKGIVVESREIRETPPTPDELAFALKALGGERRKLFNTSGAEFRSLGLKDKIDAAAENELFQWIQEQGNLCKRPLLIDLAKDLVLVGFQPDAWEAALG